MSDWDDQDLDQSEEGYAASSAPAPTRYDREGSLLTWPLIAAAVLALVAGLTLFWLFSSRGPVTVPDQEASDDRSAPIAAPLPADEEPEPEPEAAEIVLPALSESDVFVREALGTLSRHPGLASFLLTDELVRKIVAAVDNIAEGENPARHFPYLAPEEKFDVVQRSPQVFLDPRSYHRYDVLASAFASMDAEGLATVFRNAKPLMDEAYAELGYQEQTFEDALQKAISILAQTPVVEDRITLRADSVNYTFVESRLETLSPAQKQLLRTGPENTKKIQSKLRELADALDLPDAN
ncbi:MAG: hypothetical protein BMS9Abin37_0680 [Acidobacteriota bacterium]|nr:MAG: hypothetical protein BMS9Abin37_0680 [Acidobacteriota bacterium]